MSNQSHSRKAAAPGLKLVMTTAALAGTVIGWAGFARKDLVVEPPAPGKSVVGLAPLPTLVAPPGVIGVPVPSTPMVAAPPLRRVNIPAASGSVGAAAPAGAVSPVTVTRSSR